jgi:molybdate transport system substrate-binding protein
VKRRIFVGGSVLGAALLLAGGSAWTAPRQAAGGDAAKEIVLIAPTGLHMSVDQLAPDFTAKTGYTIKGTYAASGLIKKKVISGDAFDVAILLLPIDDAFPSGNLVQSSVKPLGSVPIALAVKKGAPQPDISTPDALKQTLLAAKVIAYPHGAPGAASALSVDDTLNKLGISDQILPKVKMGGAANVAKGDADYALAFQNEITDPGVDIVGPLPAAVSTPTPIVVVISSHATNPEVAKALEEFLASSNAKAVYKSKGMIPAS